MKKKAMSMLLAAVTGVTVLGSTVFAASFHETGYPICDEVTTITVSGTSATEDWNNTDLVQWIKSEMGIEMDCMPYNTEAWENQFTLMLAGENLPDLLLGVGREIGEVNNYGSDGYFLPLDEYLDYMPNFQAFLEEHPDYKAALTAEDGHIYGLSVYNTNPVVLVPRTFINQIWLDNVGMEAPESIEELYEVLKAFKEQDANGNGDADDEIPLTGNFDDLRMFMPWFGMYSNQIDYSPLLNEEGNVYLAQSTENYKAMLKFLNMLYEEGLYDADGLVQSGEERQAKFSDDRVGMMTTGGAPFTEAGTDITYDKNWSGMIGLISDYNDKHVKVYDSGVSTNVKVVVNAETEYPEIICRMLDYFYTEEGVATACSGIEGISWKYAEEDYFGYQVSDSTYIPEGYDSLETYRWKKGTINDVLNFMNQPLSTSMIMAAKLTDEQVYSEEMDEFVDWTVLLERVRRQSERVDAFPTLVYTSEESNRRATLVTDLKMYVEQVASQFIIGELDIEEGWEEYISTLEAIGSTELLSIEQTAYDRQYK